MSLNQLTANYTDSEGEDEDSRNTRDTSVSSEENKESYKTSPQSYGSRDSSANTPKKKLGRLVSYANEEDEEEDLVKDIIESDEDFNEKPMDIVTENGEEKKIEKSVHLGIKLPPAPPGKPSESLQKKVAHMVDRVKRGETDYNRKIQNNKEFRNPSIYEKLIEHLGLDEMGSNYPLEMFDPHCWGKESYYDELSKVQKEEMERREKERKDKTKIDIITGTKKPIEDELKKRKSRFDQALPGSILKPSVPPPTLTSVPSTNKTTINAFGSLKKSK